MRYTFCDYNEQLCMSSQSLLVPGYDGRQFAGTEPGTFTTGASCHWQIGSPTEWTDNTLIRVKIKKVYKAACFITAGGSFTTANKEVKCEEGKTYEFNYRDFRPDTSVFIVTYALSEAEVA